VRRSQVDLRALAALIVAGVLALAPLPALAEERLDGVAAVVDDEIILRSEVDSAAQRVIDELSSRGNGALPREVQQQIRSQAVENLIAERLILDEGDRRGLTATPDDIDAAVEGIAAQEGVEPDAIYAAAEAQGMGRDSYRKELGLQITRMKTVGAIVRSQIVVSDEEVLELFEERYASRGSGMYADVRHILVPWPNPQSGESREATRQTIREILEKVEIGENFGLLAQQYSVAPSARDGGRMTLHQGEANPDLERWAFTLDPGQVSPPVETSHGLNLIQVLVRFDPSSIRYEDVEEELRAELVERKVEPKLEKWVAELREHVYVEVVAPDLR
jgi:peptidyl-prolyl cis-trans isomerase SurA